jgi:hypothetical protein
LQLFGHSREQPILSLMGVFFVTKYFTSCTLELFFSYLFLYGRIGFTVLFFFVGTREACWYIFANFCVWVFV